MTSRTTRPLLRRLCAAGVAAVALTPLLPAAATGSTATPFTAATARTVEREGQCRQGPGEWDLKVRRHPGGRLYVEFEVDEIPGGRRWQLFMADNGRRIAAVTRISNSSRGVQVSRLTRNRPGRDRIRAAAVNPRSGSTCRGQLRF
ncbi:MAG: hypothetical protein M3165_04505 [Actinomycetota bacterium]|nr:hypothetical protein [Actinomycetota bacterium]